MLRDPAAADRWTWLLIACCAQLYLARYLAPLIRMPWHPRMPAGLALTPGQARAGFRRLRQTLPCPASGPKPSAAGPGRPKGSRTSGKHPPPRRQGRPQETQASQKPQEKDKTDRLNGKMR